MHTYKFSEVDKHTVDVATKSGKLQDKIHALGVCIMAEWARDKNQGQVCAEKMTALQNASPYHANAFSQWVALTGMQWSEEKEVWFVHVDQKCTKETLNSAKGTPFWEVSPPKKATPLTDEQIIKVLEGLLEKQKKHEKKPVENDAFTKAGNESIRTAIQQLKAVNKVE